jgi:hypothetical protein
MFLINLKNGLIASKKIEHLAKIGGNTARMQSTSQISRISKSQYHFCHRPSWRNCIASGNRNAAISPQD